MASLHSLSCDAMFGDTSVFGASEWVELAESASRHLAERLRVLKEIRPLKESEKGVVPSQLFHVVHRTWFTTCFPRRFPHRKLHDDFDDGFGQRFFAGPRAVVLGTQGRTFYLCEKHRPTHIGLV